MTGLPTLTVELEDAAGNFTHDVTQFVRLDKGWSTSRGRNDEQTEPTSGDFRLRLDNDGRFTLGAFLYDGISTEKRIRLTETFGGVVSRRHVGYVQDWPTEWESPLANYAVCQVTSVDRLSRLARRKMLSITEHEILADSPVAYYRLSEAAGAVSAGDTSGNARSSLVRVGTGTPPAFGAAGLNAWDGLTATTFATGGAYLRGDLPVSLTQVTLECFFTTSAPPPTFRFPILLLGAPSVTTQLLIGMDTTGFVYFGTDSNRLSNSTSLADGKPHHLVGTWDGATRKLFVDGVQVATDSLAGVPPSGPIGILGEFPFLLSNVLGGTVSHFAIYGTALPLARVVAHRNAAINGFDTERSDERVMRLASHVGVATVDQALEVGQQQSIAVSGASGKTALAAMREVVQAEGGLLFVDGAGDLVMQNKAHRVLTASATPALTITVDQITPGSITISGDKNYLVNTATGSRAGGADQRSVNDASVTKYEAYEVDRSNALIASDALLLDQLTWVTNIYGGLPDIRPRLSSFTLDLFTLPDAVVMTALAIELGDRVLITDWPPTAPFAQADVLIEGIKEAQTEKSWSITFNAVPASLFHAAVYDTASATADTGLPVYF